MSPLCRSALLVLSAIAAPALAEDNAELEYTDSRTITVTGEKSAEPAAVSATKTGTPLLDTPQSVTVLSRAQIDDQGFDQLNDALRYVPGVSLGQGEGHRDQVIIRGQASTADFFLDGLRDDAQYYRPLYNTEQVEVLKGANALLFGRGGGGGVINRVSKVPVFGASKGSASGSIDSFSAWSLAGDVNQPLGEHAALRLNGTYEAFDNHRDQFDGRFIGVAPTLGVKLGAATTLTLAYEYIDDARTTDRGIPSLNGVPISGYDKTFFGDPVINQSTVTAHFARARIDHYLSDSLTFNVTGQFATYDKFYGNVVPGAATATTVSLSGYDSDTTRTNWIGQANLVWKGETGGIGHTLLAGFEAADQHTDASRSDLRFAVTGGGSPLAAITVPLGRTITVPAVTYTAPTSSSLSDVRTLSVYVQDQVALTSFLQIIAGVRYDHFRMSSRNRVNGFAGASSQGRWSPRLGVVIKPRADISLYASYAKSFLPQAGDQFSVLAANTQSLDPEEFRNLEAGVKWEIAKRLTLSTALFQVDRLNTRVNDPANNGFFLLSGKNRVRGFEAALIGQITPAWQASLGYSWQQGDIRSAIASGTATIPAGRQLDKLPHHQFSAWTRYNLSPALGLGLGIVHQSSQFAAISNAVRLPAFTRVDAAVYYDLSQRVSLQLNVENLFDANYYPSAHADNNIAPGKPLNAKLTARVKF